MSKAPKRYDVTLVPAQPNTRIAEGNAVSLLRHMVGIGVASPFDEAVAKSWVEVYSHPGTSAHVTFIEGPAPDHPAFLEAVLRWGDAPVTLRHRGQGITVWFYLQFCGCAYDHPMGTFLQRIEEMFHVKPNVLWRPHHGLPHHRAVPENQRRQKEAPPERAGRVGTFVEEF